MIDVILGMEYNHVEYTCNFCRFWKVKQNPKHAYDSDVGEGNRYEQGGFER